MKGLVETKPRIDVARKFVRFCYNRLERCTNEGISVRLAAGQCAGVAAKKWQVRGEFLAKRHDRVFSLNRFAPSLGGGSELLQPWKDRSNAWALPPPEM